MRRKITLLLLSLALVLVIQPLGSAASADDVAEYHAVVKLVESHYRVKHKGLPFLANAGMKTARITSSTVRKYSHFAGFKLALFEDQDFARGDHTAFHAAMRRTLEPAWSPLVVVRGAGEGQTYTYTREDRGKFKVLICVIGERDGTVLQVELNEEEFARLLLNPEQESKTITDEVTSQPPEDKN